MIGMMNVPCDSPAEFYAAPDKYIVFTEDYDETINEPSSYSGSTEKSDTTQTKRPSLLSLFSRRKTSNIKYLQDGRKTLNGELVEVKDKKFKYFIISEHTTTKALGTTNC